MSGSNGASSATGGGAVRVFIFVIVVVLAVSSSHGALDAYRALFPTASPAERKMMTIVAMAIMGLAALSWAADSSASPLLVTDLCYILLLGIISYWIVHGYRQQGATSNSWALLGALALTFGAFGCIGPRGRVLISPFLACLVFAAALQDRTAKPPHASALEA